MPSKKKSAAQIRRMQARAEARGESYTPPTSEPSVDNRKSTQLAKAKQEKRQQEAANSSPLTSQEEARVKAMMKYEEEMKKIEKDESLNAKTRRAAKRRTEAIALEACKTDNDDIDSFEKLLSWFESHQDMVQMYQQYLQEKKEEKSKNTTEKVRKAPSRYPYILFFGQIPFTATSPELKDHLQKHMGDKFPLSDDILQIRIPLQQPKDNKKRKNPSSTEEHVDDVQSHNQEDVLAEYDNTDLCEQDSTRIKAEEGDLKNDYSDATSSKPQRNRGYAFIEFSNTEYMFAALKLHHTNLNGRRINVYRTSGGGKASRLSSQEAYKQEQQDSLNERLQNLLQEFIQSGKLSEDELDERAIMICQRRDVATVEKALERYVELKAGRELHHASAFFTKLLSETETDQGITDYVDHQKDKKDKEQVGAKKKRKTSHYNTKPSYSSLLEKQGVDMSASAVKDESKGDDKNKISRLFPSMQGTRGRKRGAYM